VVRRRRFPATLDSLAVIRDFVLGEAAREGLSDTRHMVLELVLEELVVNIVSYAYACPDSRGGHDPAMLGNPVVSPVENIPKNASLVVLCGPCPRAQEMHAPLAEAIAHSGVQPNELFCVVLEDEGVAFDPLTSAPPVAFDDDLESRRCGGLGIHFARERAAAMAYERVDGRNRLGFSVLLH
jgi:anti-sigma regulatory factor (Ser/Thr protein kinase)